MINVSCIPLIYHEIWHERHHLTSKNANTPFSKQSYMLYILHIIYCTMYREFADSRHFCRHNRITPRTSGFSGSQTRGWKDAVKCQLTPNAEDTKNKSISTRGGEKTQNPIYLLTVVDWLKTLGNDATERVNRKLCFDGWWFLFPAVDRVISVYCAVLLRKLCDRCNWHRIY